MCLPLSLFPYLSDVPSSIYLYVNMYVCTCIIHESLCTYQQSSQQQRGAATCHQAHVLRSAQDLISCAIDAQLAKDV
jgi:hypothetical protein